MCSKKTYTEKISQFAEDLSIKIVYSSLPDFMKQYMVRIRESDEKCSFRERIITQEEAQIINVDDISVELDITIEDIVSKKVYVINGFTDFTDYESTLYVGAYFTAFIFRLKGQKFDKKHISQIANLLDMSAFATLLDITSYTCQLFHAVAVAKDDLWRVLDQEAFSKVGAHPINQQLSETYQDGDFDIDLIRDLRKVRNEANEEEYVSHIKTIVHLPPNGKQPPQCIEKAVHAAEEETTLCFSE